MLADLVNLPTQQRDEKCRALFDAVFVKHRQAFRTTMRHLENPSSPENTQSTFATQHGLCLALFATARYGQSATLNYELAELNALRHEIDGHIASHRQLYPDLLALVFDRFCAPDRQALLNVFIEYATTSKNPDLQKFLEECDCVPRELTICAWNAQTTSFDLPHRLEGVPIDVTKGVTTHTVYEWKGEILSNSAVQIGHLERARRLFVPK